MFGCICYVHIPNERRKKLDVKADKCIFLGYATNSKGYKCYNPVTKAFYVSRDVTFDEVNSWFPHPASRGPQDMVHSSIKKCKRDSWEWTTKWTVSFTWVKLMEGKNYPWRRGVYNKCSSNTIHSTKDKIFIKNRWSKYFRYQAYS